MGSKDIIAMIAEACWWGKIVATVVAVAVILLIAIDEVDCEIRRRKEENRSE